MAARKVILVNPRICSPRSARLPLSLLALGAVLEGTYGYEIIDGNMDDDAADKVLAALADGTCALVGMTVMPGPQVAPAIAIASAVRAAHPSVPIAWGGYFPTLYPDSAINAPYVDYLIRGQGQETLLELLERLPAAGPPGPLGSARDAEAVRGIRGLSWKDRGQVVHNEPRPFRAADDFPPYPYARLGPPGRYLRPSYMGTRTAVHEAAIGCRYRCSFCGVVSMFDGLTRLSAPGRLDQAMAALRDLGANALQFYDNNFFDREETSIPTLEVLARHPLPWWCYARADTLAKFSARTWDLVRRSGLTMAYIGAEAGSDEALRRMKKGSKVEHTFEVARRCREHGIIPEFSFVLGGPEDPEGEVEKTLQFIRGLKAIHPRCEVILYYYSPTPQRDPAWRRADAAGPGGRIPVLGSYGPDGPPLPTTPEEWTEPRWISYVCHQDAPWLTPTIRRRVRDFGRVLACRFPTVQDYATPAWGKALLRNLARWRYATGRYRNPWELELASRFVRLRRPQAEGL
jgi:anaerobic magnesium-protoporphyrin IX monomethyl ester cyclase